MKLWLFLSLLLLVVDGDSMDCSFYTVDTTSGAPYAYRWFPPDTIPVGSNWEDANSFCARQCETGCQLAIVRNTSTVTFLYSLQTQGQIALNSSQAVKSFIGLSNQFGVWKWNDGQVCDRSLISDPRCGNNVTNFDNSGTFGAISRCACIHDWTFVNKIDDTPGDGTSFYCEVPGNLLFITVFADACSVSACSSSMCPGWSVPNPSTGTCSICPEGRFQNSSEATSCVSCQDGQTNRNPGSSICQNCKPGRYSDVSTNGRCDYCPLGKYQPNQALSYCIPCSGLHSTNTTGALTGAFCTNDCIEGTWQTPDGSCSPCPSGKFLDSSSKSCISCAAGRFGEIAGATSIQQCLSCPAGKFSSSVGSSSSASCQRCVNHEGIHCLEGSRAMFVDPGFWSNGTEAAQCVPSEACRGGEFTSSLSVDTFCTFGYSGTACNSCAGDFFRVSGLCRKCLAKGLRFFLMVLSALIVVLLVRASIIRAFQIPQNLKLSLFWFQVLSMYPLLFQGWPSELQNLFNFFSVVNLDIGYFGVGCDMKRPFYQLTFLKLSFVPLLWVSLVLLERLVSCRRSSLNSFKKNLDKINKQCLFILNFFALQMFSALFQIFNCVPSQDQFRLKADPFERCYDQTWFYALGGIMIFIALYFGVIPGYLVLRFTTSNSQESKSSFVVLFSQICDAYRADCKGFEMVRLLFKFWFVIIRDVLSVSRLTKTAFLVLLFSVQIWLESWYKPYKDQEANGLSMM
jgi:hypothetical protein